MAAWVSLESLVSLPVSDRDTNERDVHENFARMQTLLSKLNRLLACSRFWLVCNLRVHLQIRVVIYMITARRKASLTMAVLF